MNAADLAIKAVSVVAIALTLVHGAAAGADLKSMAEETAGIDDWGGIRRHRALVNAVGYESDGVPRLSLRGEWDFYAAGKATGKLLRRNIAKTDNAWRMDRMPAGARKISVPGCWEAQGVGGPATSVPWRCWWDCCLRPLNHVFVGEGWYRRFVVLPGQWRDRRVWLKIGAVNAQGWVWVNDEQVAWVDSTCGTYKYDVTGFVRPGETNKIVVQVSNEWVSRRGCMTFDNCWGGILRDIEFEATPECCIDDAWVRGNFDRRVAEVHVEVAGLEGAGGGLRLRVTVEGESAEIPLSATDSKCRVDVPLRSFRAWSPEHPNLYWATIELVDATGRVTMSRRERFGVRKLEVRGKDVFLNGKPVFLRGAGWHTVEPRHGAHPADRDHFRAIAGRVRAAGFNLVRTHTHCKWPEFFEACDEVGLMVQPELPYYNDAPTGFFGFDPVGDAMELYEHYRRYASFAIYSGNNEGWFGRRCSEKLYRTLKAVDPDRLVMGGDTSSWSDLNDPGTSDFRCGPIRTWARGSYDPDGPFIAHEYLNISVKLDSRICRQFEDCIWQTPITRGQRREWLSMFGLDLSFGDRLQDAQHRFQAIWQKYGLESARLDPHCDGYSFWSLQDCCVSQDKHPGAYAAQALFDPFWGEKRNGLTVEAVRKFNGPVCMLVDTMPRPHLYTRGGSGFFIDNMERIWTSGDVIPMRFMLANHGDGAIVGAELAWRFASDDGTALAEGRCNVADQPLGGIREIAASNISVPELASACRATLTVALSGRVDGEVFKVTNDWPYWFFPKAPARAAILVDAAAKGVVVAEEESEAARAAIAAGRNVITLASQGGEANVRPGWWYMGDQMGVVLARHPALRHLPHDGLMSELLFRILKKGRKLPLPGVSQDGLVVVGEGADACYSYMAEKRHASGSRQIMVTGLDLTKDTPEGNAILRGAIETLAGENM